MVIVFQNELAGGIPNERQWSAIAALKNIKENIAILRDILGVGQSFDVIHLDVNYGNRDMALFFIDGFIKDDIFVYIMTLLAQLEPDQLERRTLEKLMKTYIPYVELELIDDLEQVADRVLAGPTAILIDGIDKAILVDARTYPSRNPEEPDIERVVRVRDGYVETLVLIQH